MTKVIFFGTPDYVIPVADALRKAKDIKLLACVTQPDRPVGRKKITTPSPIKIWATKKKIPVLTPTEFDKEFSEQLTKLSKKISLFVVAAYGLILPKKVIKIPKYSTLEW
jgi:methionyl-tRNA formyltransferase